jgi:pimeloyl-ACP methyl ester carboxylesterase
MTAAPHALPATAAPPEPAAPTGTAPRRRRVRLPLQPTDMQGLTRLGIDATLGITGLVEAMHHTIASGAGLVGSGPPGQTAGLTGGVYRSVRGITRAVGWGLDALFKPLTRLQQASDALPLPEREAVLAVLNGVWGDHLDESDNPLAIPMTLRVQGRPLPTDGQGWAERLPAATDRVVVLVHGLCMNDLQFLRNGHDHGAMLQALGYTPVYLHYNTGRHVARNGRDFAALLGQLQLRWPVPLRELVIVGHSMGGLVTRSACHLAAQQQQPWLQRLRALVFLGAPHHGAPLERGGHLLDRLLGVSPYVAPFARLGKSRSAGITDLRFGNLQDADLQGRHRHDQRHDSRVPMPLPEGVPTYLVAATSSERADGLRGRKAGDGLVPLTSALGQHREPAHTLPVPPERQLVITSANHWDLLDRAEVAEALRRWLA